MAPRRGIQCRKIWEGPPEKNWETAWHLTRSSFSCSDEEGGYSPVTVWAGISKFMPGLCWLQKIETENRDMRGRGYGTLVTLQVAAELMEQGCKTIEGIPLLEARPFWQRFGYEEESPYKSGWSVDVGE